MKRFHYYILFTMVLAVFSCKKFLTTKPTDTITQDNFYANASQLNTALTTVYSTLMYNTYSRYIPCDLSTSDEAYPGNTNPGGNGAINNPYIYQFDFTNAVINPIWSGTYQSIENANLLMENINKPAMADSTRKNILAQAQFLRGFAHYILVSHFGDVPLQLHSTQGVNTLATRTPSAQVYASVVSDIEAAIPNLQTAAAINTTSRISQTAAQAILTRVFMTMAGAKPVGLANVAYYDSAILYAKQVVNAGYHALNTSKQGVTVVDSSYAQIFLNEAQVLGEPKECMWEATFSGDNTALYSFGGNMGFHNGIPFQATYNDASIGFGYGFINATASLYRLYGAGDTRRDWAISPYYYGGTATAPLVSSAGITHVAFDATVLYNRFAAKWRREFEKYTPKSKYSSIESVPIIRYADLLLMLAEAELQSSNGDKTDALKNVNMVRRRAYGVNINTPSAVADLTSLGLNDIIDERERELCFEGVRWLDLRRWGIFKPKMQALYTTMVADGLLTRGNQTLGAPTSATIAFSQGPLVANNAISSDKFLLLPIPSGEITVNPNMTQNPGW